jgi:hypothetical protein
MADPDSIDPRKGTRYQRHDSLSVTIVEDDAFIVNPDNQDIFHLNALGRAIWNVLAEAMSAGDVTGVITEAFPDTAPETIEADVLAFLTRMEKRGLITGTPDQGRTKPWRRRPLRCASTPEDEINNQSRICIAVRDGAATKTVRQSRTTPAKAAWAGQG